MYMHIYIYIFVLLFLIDERQPVLSCTIRALGRYGEWTPRVPSLERFPIVIWKVPEHKRTRPFSPVQ